MLSAYLMSFGAMAFSALSAFTLITFVSHWDRPEPAAPAEKHAPAGV